MASGGMEGNGIEASHAAEPRLEKHQEHPGLEVCDHLISSDEIEIVSPKGSTRKAHLQTTPSGTSRAHLQDSFASAPRKPTPIQTNVTVDTDQTMSARAFMRNVENNAVTEIEAEKRRAEAEPSLHVSGFSPTDEEIDIVSPKGTTRRARLKISPDGTRRAYLQDSFAAYVENLKERPLRTKATVGSIVGFISSLLAQRAQGKPLDLKDAFLFAVRGIPPWSHFWFNLIDGRYNVRVPALKVLQPLQTRVWARVLADQFFWRLLLTLYTFLAMGVLRRAKWFDTRNQIRTSLIPAWKAQLTVGIPQAILNQGFVPVDFRTTFNDAVSLIMNTILAMRA